ncbi:hypothetical protein STAQ_25490 [Allostella sp. ATCC 35155]|nr:hypothetical protein STAQ_25490 [Stella sp. ATCC 35155]
MAIADHSVLGCAGAIGRNDRYRPPNLLQQRALRGGHATIQRDDPVDMVAYMSQKPGKMRCSSRDDDDAEAGHALRLAVTAAHHKLRVASYPTLAHRPAIPIPLHLLASMP